MRLAGRQHPSDKPYFGSLSGLDFTNLGIIISNMAKVGRPKIYAGEEKIVKTMIYLEEGAHQKLKHLAVEEGISMTALLRMIVNRYLASTE